MNVPCNCGQNFPSYDFLIHHLQSCSFMTKFCNMEAYICLICNKKCKSLPSIYVHFKHYHKDLLQKSKNDGIKRESLPPIEMTIEDDDIKITSEEDDKVGEIQSEESTNIEEGNDDTTKESSDNLQMVVKDSPEKDDLIAMSGSEVKTCEICGDQLKISDRAMTLHRKKCEKYFRLYEKDSENVFQCKKCCQHENSREEITNHLKTCEVTYIFRKRKSFSKNIEENSNEEKQSESPDASEILQKVSRLSKKENLKNYAPTIGKVTCINCKMSICKKCSVENTIIWYNNSTANQPEKYHKCKFCTKSLSSAIELNDHVNYCTQFSNHTIQGTKCKICGEDFKTLLATFLHIIANHDIQVEPQNMCEFCGEKVSEDIEAHKKECGQDLENVDLESFDSESDFEDDEETDQTFQFNNENIQDIQNIENVQSSNIDLQPQVYIESKLKAGNQNDEVNFIEICPICNGKFLSAESHLKNHHQISENGLATLKKTATIKVINLNLL